jgi:hypothetical protein
MVRMVLVVRIIKIVWTARMVTVVRIVRIVTTVRKVRNRLVRMVDG